MQTICISEKITSYLCWFMVITLNRRVYVDTALHIKGSETFFFSILATEKESHVLYNFHCQMESLLLFSHLPSMPFPFNLCHLSSMPDCNNFIWLQKLSNDKESNLQDNSKNWKTLKLLRFHLASK